MTKEDPLQVHLLGVGGVRTQQSSETSRPSTVPGQLQPAGSSNCHQI